MAIDDAIEEALFSEQGEVAAAEQARFERTVEQIERFIEDRLLLRRRNRRDIEQRIDTWRARRDQAVSASSREEAERSIVKLGQELESLDAEIDRLQEREDTTYRRCLDQLHTRRYAPPRAERLFEVEFILE
jgi:hypothetical protein